MSYEQHLDVGRESFYYSYDPLVLKQILGAFLQWDKRPAPCSVDICVTGEGKTLLVEFNDTYALGCYGLAPIFYAK